MTTWQLKRILLKNAHDELEVFYLRLSIPGWIQGTIVDLETRGLRPHEFNLTGVGLIKENYLSAFVITPESEARGDLCQAFHKWACWKVQERCPRPLAAYYKDFEESWLNTSFNIELQHKNRNKKDYAIDLGHIDNTSNAAMMDAAAPDIMYHLVADLLQELALYFAHAHSYRNYSFRMTQIDDWFREQEEQQQKTEVPVK